MSTAWNRFDAEVQQLKQLCTQISGQRAPSVQAVLRSQPRRQSAANRQAIANLRTNVQPQSTVAVNMHGADGLTSRLTYATIESQTLSELLQRPPTAVEMSRPCTSTCTYSTSAIQTVVVTSSHLCPPTVCSTHTASHDAPQPAASTGSIDSELDTVHFTWTDRPCVLSQSGHVDDSVHLLMSAGNISTVSTVTSESVTDVSAIRQAPHSVGKSPQYASQLSALNCRDVEGWHNNTLMLTLVHL